MNVFVLCTGRCGSTTFYEACTHITNYTAAHESRSHLIGESRLKYPPRHIEADNRLSWVLGRLENAYGDDAIYVHLERDRIDTARSFTRRYKRGSIIKAYREGILLRYPKDSDPIQTALDYCDTIHSNIELFLRNKTRKMLFALENAKSDFPRFWELIGAEGDFAAALAEWDVSHNDAAADAAKRQATTTRSTRIGQRAFRAVERLFGMGKTA